MKVEIWSDVVCPFCYLGKHIYEEALNEFSEKEFVETIWKSFQLDPTLPKDAPAMSTYEYLSEKKGMPVSQARQMTDQLATRAAESGLEFHFDKAVIANTFDAHRLNHLGQAKGLGSEIEEKLFEAHFTNGENVADKNVLQKIGEAVGIPVAEVEKVVEGSDFSGEVNADIQEARMLGVRGVPFFVFNRKYAVSGAQPKEVFLKTLEKAFAEWRSENPVPTIVSTSEGASCNIDGECN